MFICWNNLVKYRNNIFYFCYFKIRFWLYVLDIFFWVLYFYLYLLIICGDYGLFCWFIVWVGIRNFGLGYILGVSMDGNRFIK